MQFYVYFMFYVCQFSYKKTYLSGLKLKLRNDYSTNFINQIYKYPNP